MCQHLTEIERDLLARNVRVIYRGQPWSKNCREWVYFDCYLDDKALREKYHLPDFVEVHVNNDEKSGKEAGICCNVCQDAIIGVHADLRAGKIVFP